MFNSVELMERNRAITQRKGKSKRMSQSSIDIFEAFSKVKPETIEVNYFNFILFYIISYCFVFCFI